MGILGSIMASKQAGKVADAYETCFLDMYGKRPQAETVESIRSCAMIIGSFAGAGNDALGASKLSDAVDSFARSVRNDSDSLVLGLGLLVSMCAKPNGKPYHGYGWAFNVLNNKAWQYCPELG